MSSRNGHQFTFDGFEVDPSNRELRRDGVTIPLQGKVFEVLLAFVEDPDRLLSKDELIEKVWQQDFVEEGNLARHVSTLRKALGDTEKKHKYILTVQGKGYRFIGALKPQLADIEISPAVSGNVAADKPRRWVLIIAAGTIAAFLAIGFAFTRFPKTSDTVLFSKPPVFHKLTSTGHVLKLALSPDGNLVAFTSRDKNGESLFVRQTTVSNEVALASVKGEISSISFSPDSKLIFYSVFRGDASESELFSVPILGGVSRSFPGLFVSDFSFAPDGYHFASVNTSRDRGETVLVVEDLDNGSYRELIKRRYPSDFSAGDKKVAWAPDGSSIAVVVNENSEDPHFSTLLLVDPDTGEENKFTAFHWKFIDSVQWVSDGSGLVVAGYSENDEPGQVFIVSLDGSVHRITDDVNDYSLVAANAANRTILAVQTIRTGGIWNGSLSPPQALAELTSGSGVLAPIAFTNDEIVFRTRGIGGSDLWGIPLQGGDKRPLTQDANVDPRGLCATSDGKVVFPSRRSGKANLWRFDGADGSLKQITFGETEIFPACTSDGRSVIFQSMAATNKKTSLWKVDIDGGEPIRLTDFYAARSSISPDGKWIAAFYMDDPKWRVCLIPIEGGQIEKSFDLPEGMVDRVVRWTPDGKSLLLIGNYGNVGNIWRIPIDGGPAQKFTEFDQQNLEDFIVLPSNGTMIVSRSTTISDAYIATSD